ncbi:hypothetical protein [Planococcus shixiaomingii]|uniref:hypothetical protein n=1 Tax=Planococcus shixiaomingii TaxID=3058393 RepID=UPI0026091B1D|nr:hypothetical protein [Planococcus sp. N022]WKA56808.1 hypothetical protein QWY21_19505 [Planococcus sp. N022]
MTLDYYEKRFEIIMLGRLTGRRKDLALADLMTDMESAFDIPKQENPEWEQENIEVMELYHKVSNSRKL